MDDASFNLDYSLDMLIRLSRIFTFFFVTGILGFIGFRIYSEKFASDEIPNNVKIYLITDSVRYKADDVYWNARESIEKGNWRNVYLAIHHLDKLIASTGYDDAKIYRTALQGSVLLMKGNYIKALNCHLEALDFVKDKNYFAHMLYGYRELIKIYKELNLPEETKKYEHDYKVLAKQMEFHPFETIELKDSVERCKTTNPYIAAIAAKELFYTSRNRGDLQGMGLAQYTLGDVLTKHKKDYVNGLMSYQQALSIYERLDDREGIAKCYKNIGRVYYRNEFYDIAEDYYRLALHDYEFCLDLTAVSDIKETIANLYIDQQQYITAAFHVNIALDMAQRARDQKQIAKCHNTKGVINQLKEKLDDAIVEHEKAVYYAHEAGDAAFEAEMYNNLGNDYRLKGDFVQALSSYQECIKYKSFLGNDARYVLLNAAILLTQSNRFKEAEEYLFEAVFLADQNQSYADLRDIKKELGRMYKRKGDDEKSEYYYLQSDELDEKVQAQIKEVGKFLTHAKTEILTYTQHIREKSKLEAERRIYKRWLITLSLLGIVLGIILNKYGSKIRQSYNQHKQEERLKNKVISEVSRMVQEQEQKNDTNAT